MKRLHKLAHHLDIWLHADRHRKQIHYLNKSLRIERSL